jgi:hypothetical protein
MKRWPGKSTRQELNILFIQLACRKDEILSKLKSYRSNFSILNSNKRSLNGHSPSNPIQEIESGQITTVENALRFAIQRECRTFELYKKLEKVMLFASTKALFDYLTKSQYALMEFLSLKHSAQIAA